jgi:hypothetical protein
MSVALYTISNILITNTIESIIPGYDTIKVINRLLSGDFHAQNIGTGARIVSINTLYVDETNKALLDDCEATGTLIKAVKDGKYYTGYIKAAPGWSQTSPGYYRASIELLVTKEGMI